VQKISSLIISIYITALLYANVFFLKELAIFQETGQLFWNNLAIFLIILIPVYLLINRYISTPYSRRGAMRGFRTLFVAFALVGLVLTIFYHIIPLESIYNLPPQIDQFFASETAFTIWLIVPLIALFI